MSPPSPGSRTAPDGLPFYGLRLRILAAMPGRHTQAAALLLAVAMAAAAWLVTHEAGGTRTAYVHMAYLPILAIALVFGARGTVAAAAAMTLLFGPLLPLDVAAGTPQQTFAWLVRGGFFVGIGLFVWLGAQLLREALREQHDRMLFDEVTGLPTKAYFFHKVVPALAPEAEYRLYVVRLHATTRLLAAFGQEIADRVEHRLAQRLVEAGMAPGDLFRSNGSEFGVLERPDSAAIVRAALATVRDPVEVDGMSFFTDATVGMTTLRAAGDPGVALRRAAGAADFAYERNKASANYSRERDESRAARLIVLGDLLQAIGTEQLFLVYQPKIRLSDGAVEGVEALLRWQHPRKGLIPPGRFIPMAEQSPIMTALTFDVMLKALRQAARWRAAGLEIPVAVNVSARDLSEEDFAAQIQTLRRGWPDGLLPIGIEVTESAAFLPDSDTRRSFAALRTHGFRIAIDDYGAGHSSLAYLRDIPADQLKLDGQFVRHCATSRRDLAFVRSTVALAHDLGLEVVAEGVEDEATADALRETGCDIAQGYHFARPMPPDAMTRFLAEHLPPRARVPAG